MEAVKPVCTHDGGCPEAAGPKHSHFEGGTDVSSAISPPVRVSVELPSLLANSRRSDITRFCKNKITFGIGVRPNDYNFDKKR